MGRAPERNAPANATPGILSDLGAGSPNLLLYTGAFRETTTRFIPRWFPEESRFTLQLRIEVPGGGTSPAEEVRLFQGPKRDGRCQGQPFATARPQAGAATRNRPGLETGSGIRVRGDLARDGL